MRIISIDMVFTIHGSLHPLLRPELLLALTSRRTAVHITWQDFPAIYKCIMVHLHDVASSQQPLSFAFYSVVVEGHLAPFFFKEGLQQIKNWSSRFTRLALQLILDKGFKLFSFQLPDLERGPALLFIVTTSLLIGKGKSYKVSKYAYADCSVENQGGVFFLCYPYLCQNWVIYAPAAFLGCGGHLKE